MMPETGGDYNWTSLVVRGKVEHVTASDPTEEVFGQRLRENRTAARLSQRELAEEMQAEGFDWHQTTVQRVETGKRSVRLSEAVVIARILGITLDLMLRPPRDDQRGLKDEFELISEQYNLLYDQHTYAQLQVRAANANLANAIKERDARQKYAEQVGTELQRLDLVRRSIATAVSHLGDDSADVEGICVNCRRDISQERLKEQPDASLCFACLELTQSRWEIIEDDTSSDLREED